jgi:hypothetical protein
LKEFFEHIKRIAIADTRLFFEPYVTVYRFIRSLTKATSGWIKRRLRKHNKADDQ